MSLPRNMPPAELTLQDALALLELPRTLGSDDNGQTVSAGIGRFGPYLKLGSTFKSLPASENILTVDLPRALELLATAKAKVPPQEIGTHPADGKPIVTASGRFGPYVKHGSVIASVPKAIRDENRAPTLEEAIELLNAKAEKSGAKKSAKTTEKKTAAKKTTAKKATAKKTTRKTTKKTVTE